jgi:hypothetical protein
LLGLYHQNGLPGPDKESNWLPVPKDRFVLMLRLFRTKEKAPPMVGDSWKSPAVKRIK